jgi:hypothetical protein
MQFARERVRRKREEDAERQQRLDAWANASADARVSELEKTLTEVIRSTFTEIESLEHESRT